MHVKLFFVNCLNFDVQYSSERLDFFLRMFCCNINFLSGLHFTVQYIIRTGSGCIVDLFSFFLLNVAGAV